VSFLIPFRVQAQNCTGSALHLRVKKGALMYAIMAPLEALFHDSTPLNISDSPADVVRRPRQYTIRKPMYSFGGLSFPPRFLSFYRSTDIGRNLCYFVNLTH